MKSTANSDGKREEYRFEEFYEHHKQIIYNIAMEKLDDPELAFRVVEQTFLRAFLHTDQINNSNSFKSQAFIIANMHGVLEEVYSEARAKMGIVNEEEPEEDPFIGRDGFDVDQVLARNDMVADLAKYTDKLNPKEKELIFLLFFMNCTQREVARRYNVTQESIRVRIYRVKRKLAKLMLEKEAYL